MAVTDNTPQSFKNACKRFIEKMIGLYPDVSHQAAATTIRSIADEIERDGAGGDEP